MILALLAFTMLTASQPQTTVAPRPVLHDAIVAAARESAPLLQRNPYRRGEPHRVSPRAVRKTIGVVAGAAAGFLGSLVIGFGQSHGECGPTPPLLIGMTAGGGVLGWFLAGD
jgi:hypothetical protein